MIPSSPTARAAADLAAEAAPTYLLNHSYRTYLFGRCLLARPAAAEPPAARPATVQPSAAEAARASPSAGQTSTARLPAGQTATAQASAVPFDVDGWDIDEEAAFVAAMLHDLGLTERHQGDGEFDRVGAELACHFLESRGWDRDRVRLVEQAILRHTNLVAERVPVHRLVQAGAALDVAGLGHDLLKPDDLAQILRAYPRLDFATRMRSRFLDEVHRHPDGAFARLEQAVALSHRFGTNPIDPPA